MSQEPSRFARGGVFNSPPRIATHCRGRPGKLRAAAKCYLSALILLVLRDPFPRLLAKIAAARTVALGQSQQILY
jgi:hypothetical protein